MDNLIVKKDLIKKRIKKTKRKLLKMKASLTIRCVHRREAFESSQFFDKKVTRSENCQQILEKWDGNTVIEFNSMKTSPPGEVRLFT